MASPVVSKLEAKEGMRIERDSMGEMHVPVNAFYGAQTQRAVENFPISTLRFTRPMIEALGLIKRCAAETNHALGLLDAERSEFIVQAAQEVIDGKLDVQFVVDIFQTGSGTSSNMNANEVIAFRSKALCDGKVAIHPNDHVNMCQSSNDVIPTAIHVAAALELKRTLVPSLKQLATSLERKRNEFQDVVKTGRTHLMDATPITLGQEFGGYAAQVRYGIERIERAMVSLAELPLGGTAVGTGLNTHPEFSPQAIVRLSQATGIAFHEARDHFEAQAAKDALVELSGQLKTIACSLAKVANDIRWMASGPRCALGELLLPEVQPGSSIMPGKVNPVIAESVLMVVAQVIGNDAAVTMAGHSGSNFELNVMMPVMAHNLLESIELLGSAAVNFASKCVDGIEANQERLHALAEASIATCTALAPLIGYDHAAKLAKMAFESGESLRTVAMRENVLPKDQLEKALDLMAMTKPGLAGL